MDDDLLLMHACNASFTCMLKHNYNVGMVAKDIFYKTNVQPIGTNLLTEKAVFDFSLISFYFTSQDKMDV